MDLKAVLTGRSFVQTASAVALVVCLAFGVLSCKKKEEGRYGVVTGDIGDAIALHIAAQTRAAGGYFKLPFDDKMLELKLVRIHFEYLATLSPTLHFACVDLVGADGEFYDVDFYLEGRPGSMKVTETHVHKINGQPLYLWDQTPNKSWIRVPVDGASHQLLGVIKGKDEFEFTYKATLPEIRGKGRVWLPLPQSDKFQTISLKSISVPTAYRELKDTAHNNKILFMELDENASGKKIEMVFDVVRLEKGAYEDKLLAPKKYLYANRLIPTDERFNNVVNEILENKESDLVKARAVYDNVIDHMRYMKYGEGWGKGDAIYACNSLYGNCTDFHSYFIALARAAGIPARFAIGAAVPSERDDGGVDGYHCWAEFYAEGKWWPVDISEGDKYTELSIYYFGHHPANRIEFTQGRDLKVEPEPESGPINFLAYPVLEINGEPACTKTEFTFRRG